MSNLIADSKSPTTSNTQNSLIKLLVFELGKLTLALPILHVQKVIKHNALHGSGLSHVNLTHLPEQEIAVVDLHQKLFKTSLQETSQTNGYFIISKNITGESLGIMVAQSPSLIDIPLSQIRIIPESYRQADTLEIASHVAIIPQEEDTSLTTECGEPVTIFILDLERLV